MFTNIWTLPLYCHFVIDTHVQALKNKVVPTNYLRRGTPEYCFYFATFFCTIGKHIFDKTKKGNQKYKVHWTFNLFFLLMYSMQKSCLMQTKGEKKSPCYICKIGDMKWIHIQLSSTIIQWKQKVCIIQYAYLVLVKILKIPNVLGFLLINIGISRNCHLWKLFW